MISVTAAIEALEHLVRSAPPEDPEERRGFELAVDRIIQVSRSASSPDEAARMLSSIVRSAPAPRSARDRARLRTLNEALDALTGAEYTGTPQYPEKPPPAPTVSTDDRQEAFPGVHNMGDPREHRSVNPVDFVGHMRGASLRRSSGGSSVYDRFLTYDEALGSYIPVFSPDPFPGHNKFWVDSEGNRYFWRVGEDRRPYHMHSAKRLLSEGIDPVYAGELHTENDLYGLEGSRGLPIVHNIIGDDEEGRDLLKNTFSDFGMYVEHDSYVPTSPKTSARDLPPLDRRILYEMLRFSRLNGGRLEPEEFVRSADVPRKEALDAIETLSDAGVIGYEGDNTYRVDERLLKASRRVLAITDEELMGALGLSSPDDLEDYIALEVMREESSLPEIYHRLERPGDSAKFIYSYPNRKLYLWHDDAEHYRIYQDVVAPDGGDATFFGYYDPERGAELYEGQGRYSLPEVARDIQRYIGEVPSYAYIDGERVDIGPSSALSKLAADQEDFSTERIPERFGLDSSLISDRASGNFPHEWIISGNRIYVWPIGSSIYGEEGRPHHLDVMLGLNLGEIENMGYYNYDESSGDVENNGVVYCAFEPNERDIALLEYAFPERSEIRGPSGTVGEQTAASLSPEEIFEGLLAPDGRITTLELSKDGPGPRDVNCGFLYSEGLAANGLWWNTDDFKDRDDWESGIFIPVLAYMFEGMDPEDAVKRYSYFFHEDGRVNSEEVIRASRSINPYGAYYSFADEVYLFPNQIDYEGLGMLKEAFRWLSQYVRRGTRVNLITRSGSVEMPFGRVIPSLARDLGVEAKLADYLSSQIFVVLPDGRFRVGGRRDFHADLIDEMGFRYDPAEAGVPLLGVVDGSHATIVPSNPLYGGLPTGRQFVSLSEVLRDLGAEEVLFENALWQVEGSVGEVMEKIDPSVTASLMKDAESQQVERKAREIYEQGGVRLVSCQPDPESGRTSWEFEVRSVTGNTYTLYGDTDIEFPGGWIDAMDVACECPWGKWNYDRAPEYKHLEGLLCSHGLAAEMWLAENGEEEQAEALRALEGEPEENPDDNTAPQNGDISLRPRL